MGQKTDAAWLLAYLFRHKKRPLSWMILDDYITAVGDKSIDLRCFSAKYGSGKDGICRKGRLLRRTD
jgi:hypothetical protein